MADLESISQDLAEVKLSVTRMFQPNGVCDSRHRALGDEIAELKPIVKALAIQQKVQWGLIVILIGVIAKVAFFGG